MRDWKNTKTKKKMIVFLEFEWNEYRRNDLGMSVDIDISDGR